MRLCALGLVVGLATVPTMIGAEIERRHAPTIGIDGVVNAASFRAAPENFIVPNGLFSIFGEDLALRTREVRPGDLDQGRLPTSLGGVRVSVAGQPAPLYFVSPGQINAQSPTALPPGETVVQIVREGLASNPVQVKVRSSDPGLFTFLGHPVVTHVDFTLVGRGEVGNSRPTHPGQYIVIFGTGLGLTLPPVLAGQLPNFAAQIMNPIRVWVGDRELVGGFIQYAGQAPRLAGVYQINLLLPDDTPLGDPAIVIEMAGIRSQPGLTIAVDPTAPQ